MPKISFQIENIIPLMEFSFFFLKYGKPLLLNVIQDRIGTIHFIRFPTDRMLDFIYLVKSKGFAEMSSTVCATGGGSLKYAKEAETVCLLIFLC